MDLAQLARRDGIMVRENTAITDVEDTSTGARVAWDADCLTFDRVVVAAGPWVTRLLPRLESHVRLTRQQMAFFVPEDVERFRRDRFPVWSIVSPGEPWYGFPILHEGYVKLAEDRKVEDTTVEVERGTNRGVSGQCPRVCRRAHSRVERRRAGRRSLVPVHEHGGPSGRTVRYRLGPGVPPGARRRLRLRARFQVRWRDRSGDRRCRGGKA